MSTAMRRHLQTSFAGDAVSPDEPIESSIGINLILIIAVLLCFVACALLLDSIIRCVVRWFCSRAGPIDLGGNRDEIKKLPIVIHGSECSICLNEIEPGERVRLLPNCGHCFHMGCVDRWLAVRSSCPKCRRAPFEADLESSGCAEPEKVFLKALNRELGL